jgi:hypothetical protein
LQYQFQHQDGYAYPALKDHPLRAVDHTGSKNLAPFAKTTTSRRFNAGAAKRRCRSGAPDFGAKSKPPDKAPAVSNSCDLDLF